MKHIYDNIEGWFTFPKFYSKMVEKCQNGGKMVEVGTWKGKSATYMAVDELIVDALCILNEDVWVYKL